MTSPEWPSPDTRPRVGSEPVVERPATLAVLTATPAGEARQAILPDLRVVLSAHSPLAMREFPGAAVAVFESVGAAVDASRAILRSQPSTKVGLAVGDVTLGESDWNGAAFAQSYRLGELANPGGILVSPVVRILHPEGRYQASLVAETAGLAEGALELDWQSIPRRPPLLPGISAPGPDFVGRDAQLDQLRQGWVATCRGESRTMVLSGEAGIGKTRLAAELATLAAADGHLVLYGRCDEDLAVPYQPFVEVLRRLRAGREPASFERILQAVGPGLADVARAVPGFPGPASDTDASPAGSPPGPGRYRLFEAVERVLGAAAAEDPVLVVLDDLHWAGRPALLMLSHLLKAEAKPGLMLVITYRDTEVGRSHPLHQVLAELRPSPTVARLSLEGLDRAAVNEIVSASRSVAGPDPTAQQSGSLPLSADELHLETSGNPLFISQVLRDVTEGGSFDAGHRSGALPVPDGVRQLVLKRSTRLSAGAQRLLDAAAVCGHSFLFDVVAAALGEAMSLDGVLDALDETVAAGFLLEEATGQFRFSHGLVRRALYDSLERATRRRLHQRVADAYGQLSSTPGHWPVVANHLLAAAPVSDPRQLLVACRAAADFFLETLAFEAGIGVAERCLEVADQTPEAESERAEVLLALAYCRFRVGDLTGTRHAAEQAARIGAAVGSGSILARAAARYVAFNVAGERHPRAREMCDEALRLLEPDEVDLRSTVLSALTLYVLWGEGDGPLALSISAEGVELARRSGRPDTLAVALHSRLTALMSWPEPDEATHLVRELSEVAHQTGQAQHVAFATESEAVYHLIRGDVASFRSSADSLAELGEKTRYWTFVAYASVWRSTVAAIAGRFEEAVASAGDALRYGGDAGDFRNTYMSQMLVVSREQGRLAEVEPLLMAALSAYPNLSALRPVVAAVRASLGQEEAARGELDSMMADGLAAVSRDFAWVISLALLAEVASLYRHTAHAEVLIELLRPFTGTFATAGGVVCLGAVDRYLAMLADTLGDTEAADRWFAAAIALEEAAEARPLLARTWLWQARCLVQRSEPERLDQAPGVIRRATEAASALGMDGLVAELAELEKSLG